MNYTNWHTVIDKLMDVPKIRKEITYQQSIQHNAQFTGSDKLKKVQSKQGTSLQQNTVFSFKYTCHNVE